MSGRYCSCASSAAVGSTFYQNHGCCEACYFLMGDEDEGVEEMSIVLKQDGGSRRSVIMNEFGMVLNQITFAEPSTDDIDEYVQFGIRYEELDQYITVLTAVNNAKKLGFKWGEHKLYQYNDLVLAPIDAGNYLVIAYAQVYATVAPTKYGMTQGASALIGDIVEVNPLDPDLHSFTI